MKEKINLLSKGIFEYDCPDIRLSEDKICLEVEAESTCNGELRVYSENKVEIRAKIFSSNKPMQCVETDIIGPDNTIHYTFDSHGMEPGDKVEGRISLISNGGEIAVPYQVEICAPFCETSIGHVGDLDEFTRLAARHWQEAVKLFRSENFKRVCLVNKLHSHIYDKLVRGRNINQAMEEFLCTVKRKEQVRLSVSQREIICGKVDEAFADKLVIEKSGWGYQEITVTTEGDFLRVYKRRLTTEDFLGSYYELEYFIDPEWMTRGNNYGKIIIHTFFGDIEVRVQCRKEAFREEEDTRHFLEKSVYRVFRRALAYEQKAISRDEWYAQTREDVDGCRNNSDSVDYALLEAAFLTMAGEDTQARDIMSDINVRELRRTAFLKYCFAMYIEVLYRKDEGYTRYVIERFREFYSGQCDRWELLYMLIRLDERIAGGGAATFKLIKNEFEKGCHSPFLYSEALRLMNEDPSIVRELDRFEVALLLWGARHERLSQTLIYQYADLAVHEKTFNPAVLRAMMTLCGIYEKKELLAAVCGMLIKGAMTDSKYNRWYLLGIQSSLKLTQIYEYYMLSLDEAKADTLPSAVLYYFNYNNQLPAGKKAFLYRYIIEHREEIPRVYHSYDNIMKAFTHEQLASGRMDDNMACLYRHYITKDKMNRKLAEELPAVMFKYKITCAHPRITAVVVTMRDIDREFIYPLAGGKAYVDIFMDDYNIAFEDGQKHRYISSVTYEMKKMMDDSEFIKECYELNPSSAMVLMNRSERALRYQMVDEVSIDIYKRTLKLRTIRDEYRKNILKNLIDIYYENYEGETLEKYLLRLDIRLLGSNERGSIIEYYIQRGFVERAFNAISEYGYDNIQDKRLMRLCSRMIRKTDFTEDPLLLEMSFHSFRAGKYDETILQYLNRYYLGTTEEYLELWRASNAFEVDAYLLEEKTLCQVLFTENRVAETREVFDSYYKKKPNLKIVRAYLGYNAYQYLVKDVPMSAGIYQAMEIELDQMGRSRDVCSLAMLKHFSSMEAPEENLRPWIRKEISGFINRGLILPGFLKFRELLEVPGELVDRCFASYVTSPKHSVKICWQLNTDSRPGEWHEENMQNVYGGLFVKSWQVFADEHVMWYVIDSDGGREIQTKPVKVCPEAVGEEELISEEDHINRMILQKEFSDHEAMWKTAEDYEKITYMAKELFDIV